MQDLSTLMIPLSSTTTPEILTAVLLDAKLILIRFLHVFVMLFAILVFSLFVKIFLGDWKLESLDEFLQQIEDDYEESAWPDDDNNKNSISRDVLQQKQWTEVKAVSSSSISVCPICLVRYEPNEIVIVATSTCKHVFHKECLWEWCQISPTCPCC
jgi:hypothetical protein